MPGSQRWLFTLGLAQAGEFGFVLLSLALQAHVLDSEIGAVLAMIVALSMLFTPALFIAYDRLFAHSSKASDKPADDIDMSGPVIIAGQGRYGQIINRVLLSQGYQTVVLDHESEIIERLRPFGVKAFFGDPTRRDLLHAAGIKDARVLISAIDDPEQAIRLVEMARKERDDIHIIARARDRDHVYRLYHAGANDIIRETFDSAVRTARDALVALDAPLAGANRVTDAFFEHDRAMIRQLASVWDPAIPNASNPEYNKLAQELNSDIGRALEGLMLDEDEAQEDPKP